MRTAFAILIGLHGTIHLFGFLKAFEIIRFNALTQHIPKATGVFWLIAFGLLSTACIAYLSNYKYWWFLSLAGILISQLLIFFYWKDARFGTLPNIIILLVTVHAFASYSFSNKIAEERKEMLALGTSKNPVLTEAEIEDLPKPVKTWLYQSGMMEKKIPTSVYLEQEILMKLKPDQKDWTPAGADQYFTLNPPAFNWKVRLKSNPLMPIAGRDKFVNGQGTMTIKLFSLFDVAHAENEPKIDQASLQRYLAEISWFPLAAVSPFIAWQSIDEHSASATLSYNGTQGSGIFYFDNDGNFDRFEALRYMDVSDDSPTPWVVKVLKTETLDGTKVPTELVATWILAEKEWTWLKLKVTRLNYQFN